MIITESRVRLLHYDRSGAYITPFFDIHRDPQILIRLICGLSSTDESVLGFDTSISWQVDDTTGARTSGTVVTVDGGGSPTSYDIDISVSPYARPSISGRGTTCWVATHRETKQRVLVKDAWRDASKNCEGDYLAAARGVDGVVQLISFQDELSSTSRLRPPGWEEKSFRDRIKSRTVMELCGKPINHFTSRAQAIGALRDAIIGMLAFLLRSGPLLTRVPCRSPRSFRKIDPSSRHFHHEYPPAFVGLTDQRSRHGNRSRYGNLDKYSERSSTPGGPNRTYPHFFERRAWLNQLCGVGDSQVSVYCCQSRQSLDRASHSRLLGRLGVVFLRSVQSRALIRASWRDPV